MENFEPLTCYPLQQELHWPNYTEDWNVNIMFLQRK